MRTTLLPFLLGLSLFPQPSTRARQAATTPVTIEVHDAEGAAIAHAQITLEPAPASQPAAMETDEHGSLRLRVADGSYMVSISAVGFRKTSRHIVVSGEKMSGGNSPIITVTLEVQPVGGIEIYASGSLVLLAGSDHPSVTLSPADFAAIPHVALIVHNAHSNADETYSGVPLATLLAKLNAPLGSDLRGKEMTRYVVATGADHYSVVFSLAEVDPSFHAGQVIVADMRDGKPLSNDGPFRLVLTDDKRPARWVRNLVAITLANAQ